MVLSYLFEFCYKKCPIGYLEIPNNYGIITFNTFVHFVTTICNICTDGYISLFSANIFPSFAVFFLLGVHFVFEIICLDSRVILN